MKPNIGKKSGQHLIVVSLCIVFTITFCFGQRRPSKPKPGTVLTIVEMAELGDENRRSNVPQIGEFGFDVSLDAAGYASVSIVTSENSKGVSTDEMNVIYERFATFRTPSTAKMVKPIDPVVVVHAVSDTTYGSILKFVAPLRRNGQNLIKIATNDGQFIVVPGKRKPGLEIKPDPTTLVVSVNGSGDIALNNEPRGNLIGLSVLEKKLREVFKAREENGVFRSGTNDIETTVWLELSDTTSFGDILQLDSVIRRAGSDRVGLAVEDGPFIGNRKTMIEN
jgi:biopolymer transport protein ExbD